MKLVAKRLTIEVLKSLTAILCFVSVVFSQAVCNRFEPVADRCDLTAQAVDQAKCLLRPVKKFGNLGEPLAALPSPLDAIIGQPTGNAITLDQVKRFLSTRAVREADVGGSLSSTLSTAKYFVIHDTSDYLGELSDFPSNINDDASSINRLVSRLGRPVCHVYINRAGQSATVVVFESTSPPSGTKLGLCNPTQRGAFLHIENIQPRIKDSSTQSPNDAIAPIPGFTGPQLERLALIYVVASVRSGRWLIPAYHSSIDLGYPDRHDDPQNFDLDSWSRKIATLIKQITTV